MTKKKTKRKSKTESLAVVLCQTTAGISQPLHNQRRENRRHGVCDRAESVLHKFHGERHARIQGQKQVPLEGLS